MKRKFLIFLTIIFLVIISCSEDKTVTSIRIDPKYEVYVDLWKEWVMSSQQVSQDFFNDHIYITGIRDNNDKMIID